jgi:hypothetical protein
MLNEEVLEVILLNNDLNAKMFFLGVIGAYMLYAFWKYDKVGFESLSERIFKLSLFIYSRVTAFFYPIMSVTFLHINTTLEEMIIVTTAFYSIIFVITFGLLLMKGLEYILNLLGISKGSSYK